MEQVTTEANTTVNLQDIYNTMTKYCIQIVSIIVTFLLAGLLIGLLIPAKYNYTAIIKVAAMLKPNEAFASPIHENKILAPQLEDVYLRLLIDEYKRNSTVSVAVSELEKIQKIFKAKPMDDKNYIMISFNDVINKENTYNQVASGLVKKINETDHALIDSTKNQLAKHINMAQEQLLKMEKERRNLLSLFFPKDMPENGLTVSYSGVLNSERPTHDLTAAYFRLSFADTLKSILDKSENNLRVHHELESRIIDLKGQLESITPTQLIYQVHRDGTTTNNQVPKLVVLFFLLSVLVNIIVIAIREMKASHAK